MTRQEFVEAAKKGWEKYEYIGTGRWSDRRILHGRLDRGTRCVCAVAAAAYAIGETLTQIMDRIDDYGEFEWVDAAKISDNAGSKEAAIKALEEWAA